jgi:uncharacterized CHY-type Zn-finger protein
MEEIRKTCSKCKKEFPLENFTKSNQRKDGRGSFCKPCDSMRKRKYKEANPQHYRLVQKAAKDKWISENPDKVKAQKLKDNHKRRLKTHGLTQEQYNEINKGCCQICNDPFPEGKTPSIDHCHTKGHVRGILCNNCNTGLGLFKDDITRLESAIKYLIKGEITC